MKKTKKASALPHPAGSIRKVYEVYSGHTLEFDGAIVVENVGGAERIVCWMQSRGAGAPYNNDAEREADRQKMVRQAQAVAQDQKNFRRFRMDILDYRYYGLPDSKERMPDVAYTWRLYEPGKFRKSLGRAIFPYCPFRFLEMLKQRCEHLANAGKPMPIGEVSYSGKVALYPWHENFVSTKDWKPDTIGGVK